MDANNLALAQRMASFRHDPLGHALFSYPWDQGDLKGIKGPRKWQREVLDYIGQELRKGTKLPICIGIRSGNGPGKSAFLGMVANWAMSTHQDTRINLSAETEPQLRTKTWPEVTKWFELFIAKHWFKKSATTIQSRLKGHEESWRMDRMTWSEHRPEAFAGLHNSRKRAVIIIDEASNVADVIFEHAEGALTDEDTEIIFLVLGNPTRNEGYFYEIFNSKAARWKTWTLDTREIEGTNKEQIKLWAEERGEDSDWFRVHVRGLPPMAGELQFISKSLIEQAQKVCIRKGQIEFAPVICGVDTAWWGGDKIVITKRQGLASWVLAVINKNDDDSVIGGHLARLEDEHLFDAVFIDQAYGTGLYSYGKGIGRKWQLVSFAEASSDDYYENKRMEMYAELKAWLKEGGSIQNEQLAIELSWPEAFINRRGKLQLESKEEMKKRGLPSPNHADSLALTFARRVKPKSDESPEMRRARIAKRKNYNPLAF